MSITCITDCRWCQNVSKKKTFKKHLCFISLGFKCGFLKNVKQLQRWQHQFWNNKFCTDENEYYKKIEFTEVVPWKIFLDIETPSMKESSGWDGESCFLTRRYCIRDLCGQMLTCWCRFVDLEVLHVWSREWLSLCLPMLYIWFDSYVSIWN